MNNSSSIVVTGANGQLGKELSELTSLYPRYNFVFLTKEELPVHEFEAVRNFFKSTQPQYCINCAAYTAVDKAESEKKLAFRINGEAIGVLAAACRENNTKVIHISTDYVFDGNATTPYKEDSPTNPQSIYGASKLEGEKTAMQFNPDSIIIRTSWVYSEFGKNFVKTMMKLMSEKDEINVVNDQYGSPTYAHDLAKIIINIIVNCHTDSNRETIVNWTPGIYHYSNEGVITWYNFAIAIKELSGSSCKINPITTEQFPTPAKRPAYSVLDKTKIQQTFGIKLKDWKESLAICLQKIKKRH
jgi:dTDP-4-dehydrorhamnose reductase